MVAEHPIEDEPARALSAEESPGEVVTLRASAGDPPAPLPPWVKAAKKNELQQMCRARFLDDSGSRAAMMQRLQTEWPWILFEIDAREPLQR